jgi:hypothetical protein
MGGILAAWIDLGGVSLTNCIGNCKDYFSLFPIFTFPPLIPICAPL